jgi:hypothetical protein
VYEPGTHDRTWDIPVWGRFGNTKDKLIVARIYRHTRLEAESFLRSLGYVLVDL